MAQGSNVVDDPDATAVCGEDEIGIAGLDHEIANCDVGEIASFILGPLLAAIERNPQAEFGAEEEEIGVDGSSLMT